MRIQVKRNQIITKSWEHQGIQMTLLAIGIGGFLGAISRFLISEQVNAWFASDFPYGTLVVNTLGSFILGFVTRYFGDHGVFDGNVQIGIMVGFLGALTTFSTFSGQTIWLLEREEYLKMSINVLSNVSLCLILFIFGLRLAKYV